MENNKTRILWSGITGRTGQEALKQVKDFDNVEIVAGVCRSDNKYYNYDQLYDIKENYDIIVDFSHKDSFNKILKYAIDKKKPIIIGTAGLSEDQEKAYEEASKIIPIFRGGNFRFQVKKFIDDVVEYAKNTEEDIEIVETFYKSKKIPSETSKVIVKRIFDETGKTATIKSYLEYDGLICDWRVGPLHCRTINFEDLAHDVLSIAVMMRGKKAYGIYDLDRLLKEQEINKKRSI